jgi:hypothetical protein
VVLWSNFQEEGGARWLQEKRARKKEARKFKARKAPDGFKPDASAGDGPERNDIRLRGVG